MVTLDPTSLPTAILTATGALGLAAAISRGADALTRPPWPAPRGCAITCYSPGGTLANAWARTRKVAEFVRPEIVILHAHYDGTRNVSTVARNIRAALPSVKIWLGVATDPAMANGANGAIATAARAVAEAGIEVVIWNAERRFKTHPLSLGEDRAREILEGFGSMFPAVVQGHTAYAQPGVHMDYPWSAWLGGRSQTGRVFSAGAAFSLPQVYPFSGAQPVGYVLPKGRFKETWTKHVRSWNAAIASGLILPVPTGAYVPGAHVRASDIDPTCKPLACTAFWPWDDPEGWDQRRFGLFSGYDEHGAAAALDLTAHGP